MQGLFQDIRTFLGDQLQSSTKLKKVVLLPICRQQNAAKLRIILKFIHLFMESYKKLYSQLYFDLKNLSLSITIKFYVFLDQNYQIVAANSVIKKSAGCYV